MSTIDPYRFATGYRYTEAVGAAVGQELDAWSFAMYFATHTGEIEVLFEQWVWSRFLMERWRHGGELR